ncbi:MAG: GDSL-type esterase/lipase family protein [Actinomycetota bacterium]|nr:GDSL-type esterase/lipase family protein [Actinomycetota bacterium]MDH5224939.1 GDSL-type esterase/lipase family protein [Actinomycetota bacterium]MDH5312625.1 GDSL-type esterase/lipase family protein [Actinomycetota bacterium]
MTETERSIASDPPEVGDVETTDAGLEARVVLRQVARALLMVGILVVISGASIAFALRVAPTQSVSALGQTVSVGATSPTWSTAGPGEVVVFGRSLPTQVDFVGPVRPRLVLTEISIDAQVEGAFAPPGRAAAAAELGEALAAGWRRYFAWEIAFVALGAVLLLGAIAGWRGYGGKRTAMVLVGGLLFVEVVNLSAIMVTAFTAPDILRGLGSVSDLVGRDSIRPVAAAAGPELDEVQAIVLGDSTAAGLGGPALADATPDDEACERSSIAFAETLARVNDWNVDNLGCSGATIEHGVLGSQLAGGRRLAPQLAVAKRATSAEVVIVNVGANDMHWSTLVFLCGASDTCDDRALTAFYQRSLDDFTQDYYELLRQLAALPGDPLVLINQYYVPFDPKLDCLEELGLTSRKIETMLERLVTLNMLLANGAETFGYRTVKPDFSGHELCADQSYVQGIDDAAPLHPNARGQLVIALAGERALLEERA